MLSYKQARRLAIGIYAGLAVSFSLVMLSLAKREIESARLRVESEKDYFESLIECRTLLDDLEMAVARMLRESCAETANDVFVIADSMAAAIDGLSRKEDGRPFSSIDLTRELQLQSRRLRQIAWALVQERRVGNVERWASPGLTVGALVEAMPQLRREIRGLSRAELDHLAIWRRQSFFFYRRLQYVLAIFFILATSGVALASYISSHALNAVLRRLSEGTRNISGGNLEYQFADIPDDEVGMVMRDFNHMARQLDERRRALSRANEELRRKGEALLEANMHKDRFLANMSHELRTPLNSIIGFAEIIGQRGARLSVEKIADGARRILKASEHLLELISDLLQVARLDSGMAKPYFSEVDVAETAREVAAMLRPMAENKGLAMEMECPDSLPLRADGRMLRQIMINLLGNAVKFTIEGKVALRVAELDGGGARLDVVDTGIGLDEDGRRDIFKDFHRVEHGLTANFEGTGLGLTLSKRLVELHGGRVIVNSAPGEGSVFSVFLPSDPERVGGAPV